MNEIEVIWKFLDNLDEYVYATDIETDELVYMNRKLLEVYGLQSIDDVKGMKCYEVLQKSSVPCGMCNNDRLCLHGRILSMENHFRDFLLCIFHPVI